MGEKEENERTLVVNCFVHYTSIKIVVVLE